MKFDPFYVELAVLYLVIALIAFYPLALNPANVIPGTGGDSYQNLWNVWWVVYSTFTLHTSFYQTNLIFYPIGANLVFETLAPLVGLFSAPFQLFGTPFAYNVMFFLGFVIAGLAMYVLADYILKNRYAAVIAGVIFAFSSFHVAQSYAHIEWMNIGWVPLALYFFIRIYREEKRQKLWSALGLAVCMVLILFMSGIELGIMTCIMFVLVAIAYLLTSQTRKAYKSLAFWEAIGLAIVLTLILGSWGLIPIITSLLQPGGFSNVNYLNSVQYNELWSDDLLSFFLPSYYNGIFNGLTQSYANVVGSDPTERSAYIGYTAVLLGIYGIMRNYKTVRNLKLWIGLFIVFGWLSLGPYLQVAGSTTAIPGLYQLYHALPIVNVVREPGRFDLFVMLAVAMLAAYGAKSLLEKQWPKGSLLENKMLVVGAIIVLFFIESTGLPLSGAFINGVTTTISVPPLYSQLALLSGNFSVLTLPNLPVPGPTPETFIGQAMYYGTIMKKPIIGGYESRENATQQFSVYNIPLAVEVADLLSTGVGSYQYPVAQNYTNQTLFSLYNYNTAFVVLNNQAFNESQIKVVVDYLEKTFGNPVYVDNTTAAFDTANAVNDSIFRSYVAYPLLEDWGETEGSVNGNLTYLWIPENGGPVLVYAPYPVGTNVNSALQLKQTVLVNTTITFQALTNAGTGRLIVAQETTQGAVTLAIVNVTPTLSAYSVNAVMYAGPVENFVLFGQEQSSSTETIQQNQTIALTNIRFSRQKA